MTGEQRQPIFATACVGDSCKPSYALNRRQLLASMAGGAGMLALTQFGMEAGAQDQTMIENLNLGSFGGGSNPQINFNVYSPNSLANGAFMFESLYIVNGYNCEQVPWLATSFEFTSGSGAAGATPAATPMTEATPAASPAAGGENTVLTFTMREGVTWSDGTPLTSEDVAFTFNFIKGVAGFDKEGVWASETLASVEAPSPDKVVFNFTTADIPNWYRICRTKIVPKHQWETFADPQNEVNATPIGSGPFKYESFNGEQLVGVRNETWWQAEKLRINKVTWHKAPAEAQVNQLRLANGEYDWDAMYIPNVEQVYVAKDPEHNKYWFDQGGLIGLGMNLTKAPFNDLNFRKALALGIDRDKIIQNAQLGYVTQASQTGLKLPGQQDWLDPNIPNQGLIGYDEEGAKAALDAAGYAMDGDSRLGLDGQPIQFRLMCPAGWADWILALQIIQENCQALGITVNVETPEGAVHDQDRASGNYDTFLQVHGGGCDMFQNFFDAFASVRSAEIGKPALSNFIRYNNPEYDGIVAQLQTTPDVEAQKQLVLQLQNILYNDMPVIDIWYGAKWYEYRTENAEGWPSAENPYCSPNDNPELVLINLVPPGEGS